MAANLLSNASVTGGGVTVGGGSYVFTVDGTFGGATVALQIRSPDGSSWLAITDASFTAEGNCVVELGDGSEVRVTVTGGSPSALYANIARVE